MRASHKRVERPDCGELHHYSWNFETFLSSYPLFQQLFGTSTRRTIPLSSRSRRLSVGQDIPVQDGRVFKHRAPLNDEECPVQLVYEKVLKDGPFEAASIAT
jgi:hypothetical protein